MRSPKIVTMKLARLKPAPYNPRTINDHAMGALKESLKKFGVVEPIVFNRRSGYVVGGHQRLKALADLGVKDVQVVVVDLDDKDEKTLNVALNKITGEWSYGPLADLIRELEKQNADLKLTGFPEAELKTLLAYGLETAEKISNELGLTPEQRKEIYDNNTIKQIVLYFPTDEYESVLVQMKAILETEKLEDNSQVVLHLLKFYAEANR